jgi:hypothetical protein
MGFRDRMSSVEVTYLVYSRIGGWTWLSILLPGLGRKMEVGLKEILGWCGSWETRKQGIWL